MSTGVLPGAPRVVVASTNPVKCEAVEHGFRRMAAGLTSVGFDVEGARFDALAVPSGVPDQPLSDEETLRGAWQRARGASARVPEARFWVGLEGGLMPRRVDDGGRPRRVLEAFGWAVVRDHHGREGRGRSAGFELPPAVTRAVLDDGLELGAAVDRLAGTVGLKHRGGAVGLLSGGALRRAELYVPAVLLALLPLVAPALYSDADGAETASPAIPRPGSPTGDGDDTMR
ncbi:MAG: inosine/xanthosine triphosphatase [Acidobacteriota bacterium]